MKMSALIWLNTSRQIWELKHPLLLIRGSVFLSCGALYNAAAA